MRSRFIITLLATLALGCNVFFATDSVEPGDQPSTNGTSEPEPTPTSCATSCTCESDCIRTCDSNCTLTCESGACDFSAEAGATVTCEAGSDCYLDCEGGNCSVACEPGASCALRCGPRADSCEITECEGSRGKCGALVETCNADCS